MKGMKAVRRGVIRKGQIELKEPLPLPDGVEVEVTVKVAEEKRGMSPRDALKLAGTLGSAEAKALREALNEFRKGASIFHSWRGE